MPVVILFRRNLLMIWRIIRVIRVICILTTMIRRFLILMNRMQTTVLALLAAVLSTNRMATNMWMVGMCLPEGMIPALYTLRLV